MKILGVNKRHYPMMAQFCFKGSAHDHCDLQCGDPILTLAVLVEGKIGDYACYVGHGTPEWVARFGDKISFEEASGYFPGIKEEKYRS